MGRPSGRRQVGWPNYRWRHEVEKHCTQRTGWKTQKEGAPVPTRIGVQDPLGVADYRSRCVSKYVRFDLFESRNHLTENTRTALIFFHYVLLLSIFWNSLTLVSHEIN